MTSRVYKKIYTIILAFSLGILFCCARAATADTTAEQNVSQNSNQNSVSSRLQVSGAADKLSLDSDHADVQSVLRAILKQSGKQFQPDGNVTGQLTLLLNDQPLSAILNAVCEQNFLKFDIDSNTGAYRFHRDDTAVRKAFSDLNSLNNSLRQQLRAMGIDLPADEVIDNPTANRNLKQQGADASELQGGINAAGNRVKADNPSRAGGFSSSAGPAGRSSAKTQVDQTSKNSIGYVSPLPGNGGIQSRIHTQYASPETIIQSLKDENRIGSQYILNNSANYQEFLKRNNFVSFNIPAEKPSAVTTVLQQFSEQANVPVLIDQTVPNSLKFRVWGSMPPRPISEALNLLATTAHLQWRWVGNSIWILPTPEFIVALGNNLYYFNSSRSDPAPTNGPSAPAETGKKTPPKE